MPEHLQLAGHGGFHCVPTFSVRSVMGSSNYSSSGSIKVHASQFSRTIEVFFFVELLSTCRTTFQDTNDQVW